MFITTLPSVPVVLMKYPIIANLVKGALTLANGGMGDSHPYLTGTKLPSYLGLCADEACAWMDQVQRLREVQNLRESPFHVTPDPWLQFSRLTLINNHTHQ